MQNLTHTARGDNRPRGHGDRTAARTLALALLGCLVLAGCFVLAGCRGESSSPDASVPSATPSATTATRCALRVDTSGLAEFLALADRIATSDALDSETLSRLGQGPVYARWLDSLDEKRKQPINLGNWMDRTFRPGGFTGGPGSKNVDMKRVQSFRFVHEHAQQITPFVESFRAEQAGCGIFDHLDGFIDAERLPDLLYLDFLAGSTEIRFFDDHLLVDAGLAYCSGREQLVRILASVIYRQVQAIPGGHPRDASSGGASVAEVFRILTNEGIAAWLEDSANLFFAYRHPRLRGATPVPRDIFVRSARMLAKIDQQLSVMFADPEKLAAEGYSVSTSIAAAGAFEKVGYAMACVIKDRLGRQRLQAGRLSPLAFVNAYQEAASMRPDQAAQDTDSRAYFLEQQPAFSDAVAAGLGELLAR